MTKRVLSIGQCRMDHGSIAGMLERHFAAETVAADGLADGVDELRCGAFDLVLVNRRLDSDGGDGLEVIRGIKSERALAATPVMLVTNFPEFQAQAIALGAEPGFGKSSINAAQTKERLASFLK
jgi:two-component system, chemotaxis family, chemotaxis protein CheY